MLFKQGVAKEEKWCAWALPIGMMAMWFPICLAPAIQDGRFDITLCFTFVVFLLFILPFILLGLSNMEWFHIYADRLECNSTLGQKNVVHFCNVAYVEEIKINWISRGDPRIFYIFHDGRKSYNDKHFFSSQSCYNKKEFALRIRKTPEMEDFIVNTLHFEIRTTKTQWD